MLHHDNAVITGILGMDVTADGDNPWKHEMEMETENYKKLFPNLLNTISNKKRKRCHHDGK